MALETGQTINQRYRIVELIGRGSGWDIYRAWDTQLQRPCAIKCNLDDTPEGLARFESEGARWAGFNQANLPKVYDRFNLPDQGAYQALEYVEGEDLETRLAGSGPAGGLPEAEVLPWMTGVCDGLTYLHSQNPPVIHGDVKPANIRIDAQGRAVLVDYGSAEHLTTESLTQIGGRVVTPGFSPPEQYGSGALDARSDVYALGATLYALLTGVTPADSVDLMTGAAVLTPVQQLNSSISSGAARAIESAMQVNRAVRTPNAAALRSALAAEINRTGLPPTMIAGATAVIAQPPALDQTIVTAAKPGPSGVPPLATPAKPYSSAADPLAATMVGAAALGAADFGSAVPGGSAPAVDPYGATMVGMAPPGSGGAVPPPAARTPPPGAPPTGGSPAPSSAKSNRNLIIAIAATALAILCLLAALVVYNMQQGGADQDSAVITQSAQTMTAQAVAGVPNPGATMTAAWFQTQQIPTQPLPSQTVLPPTSAPTGAAPSATAASCEKASFVTDVTIPDGTAMPPSTLFVKTWRIRNDSPCTWDAGYSVVFSSGTQLSSNSTVPFPGRVSPGETVDLSVNMQAPGSPGQYESNWLFRSPSGASFGVKGNNPVFVRIVVTAPVSPNPSFAYDFTARYCDAQWRTGAGSIPCTMVSSDPRGSSVALANAVLERGQEDEPGLWVRPDSGNNGFVQGEYPAYTIQPGDRFVSEIGCAQNATGCNVTFQLDMLPSGGVPVNLGVWQETYDGKTTVVDIDLTTYAGQTVRFQLKLIANSDPAKASALWFVPSIRNQPVAIPLPNP